MPSMVRMSRPSASADSIRQEQTSRSSSMMLQAPQSPDAQPSLEPVSASGPRKASSMVSFGSHKNSIGSPLMVVETCSFDMIFNSPRRRAWRQWQRCASAARRRSWCGRRWCRACRRSDGRRRCRRGCGVQRRIVELAADQGFRRCFDQQHGRRHRTEPDPGGRADAVLQREADAAADHGDVHFGARDHPQISIARTRRPRRQGKTEPDSPGLWLVRPDWPAPVPTGISRRPFGPAPSRRRRPRSTRHTSPAGASSCTDCRRGRAPLHLRGTDQIDRLQHAGPYFSGRADVRITPCPGRPRQSGNRHGGFLDRGYSAIFLMSTIRPGSTRRSASAPKDRCRRPGARHSGRRKCADRLIERVCAGYRFRSWSFCGFPCPRRGLTGELKDHGQHGQQPLRAPPVSVPSGARSHARSGLALPWCQKGGRLFVTARATLLAPTWPSSIPARQFHIDRGTRSAA